MNWLSSSWGASSLLFELTFPAAKQGKQVANFKASHGRFKKLQANLKLVPGLLPLHRMTLHYRTLIYTWEKIAVWENSSRKNKEAEGNPQ